jgi:hypothetical protein
MMFGFTQLKDSLTRDSRFWVNMTLYTTRTFPSGEDENQRMSAIESELESLMNEAAELYRNLGSAFKPTHTVQFHEWRTKCFFALSLSWDDHRNSAGKLRGEGILYAGRVETGSFWMAKCRVLPNGDRQEVGVPRKYTFLDEPRA